MKLPYRGGNGKTRIYHRSCVIEAIDKMQNPAALPVVQKETHDEWFARKFPIYNAGRHIANSGQVIAVETYEITKCAWNAAKGQKETK